MMKKRVIGWGIIGSGRPAIDIFGIG